MLCPNCSTENPTTNCHCTGCGIHFFGDCAGCGHSNPIDAHFCGGCGVSLRQERDSPSSVTAESQPPKSSIAPEQKIERKTISVLFADIVRSTALIDGKDAEVGFGSKAAVNDDAKSIGY